MLSPGTRLGTYEVTGHLGSGGMGDVYQARDTTLGRSVAIKVLPEPFAADPERLARFEREAKLLAALNHPNIAAIYGLERSGATRYLVMELVPGETLSDRIAREGPVPVEEALAIARQIAEALAAAHDSEMGIVHRDLKPANVKVTPEGRVKVLDFGLAKAFAGETASANISNSPTLSAMATMQGVIMGTAGYMSPEQARGKPVDKRTDIWAFGCVLYEMLTGRQAFRGEDLTEIIAAIVKSEPDWQALPAETPASIRLLLRRCLEKDKKPAVPRRRRRADSDRRDAGGCRRQRRARSRRSGRPHDGNTRCPGPPPWRRARSQGSWFGPSRRRLRLSLFRTSQSRCPLVRSLEALSAHGGFVLRR